MNPIVAQQKPPAVHTRDRGWVRVLPDHSVLYFLILQSQLYVRFQIHFFANPHLFSARDIDQCSNSCQPTTKNGKPLAGHTDALLGDFLCPDKKQELRIVDGCHPQPQLPPPLRSLPPWRSWR